MTAREIRRVLEKHKTISDRMSEVIAEMRAIDGYNQGTDISQPKASNRNLSSSVELAAEKRLKLDKELGQLLDKERQSYWEIQNLLIYLHRSNGKYRYDSLLRDCFIGELEEAEIINKYGADYQKQITAAVAKIVKAIA